jgi:hypothetical protein
MSSRGCAESLANELNWPSSSCSLLETVPAGAAMSIGVGGVGEGVVADEGVGDDGVGPGAGGAAEDAAR